MKQLQILCLIGLFALSTLLTACGGGGSSSSNDSSTPPSTTTNLTQAVAVDPYLVGAVFQEVDADNNIVQTSSPSDENGIVTFSDPLTEGNMIVQVEGGTHLGLPFNGQLKRTVDVSDGTLVVSPLTTLVADGATPAEVVNMLSEAGIDIDEADVTADPMAVLTDKPQLLIAAVAVNTAQKTAESDLQSALNEVVGPLNQISNDDVDVVASAVVAVANYLIETIEAAIQAGDEVSQALTSAVDLVDADAIESIIEETISTGASRAVVIDDSDGTLVVKGATIAEYLAAGLDALEQFDNQDNSAVDPLLTALSAFQKARALVGSDSEATPEEIDQALFFGAVTRLGLLVDPYSDLTENGLNNLGDVFDAFGVAGDNIDRADLDLIEIDSSDLPADAPTSGDLQLMLQQKVKSALNSAINDLGQVSEDFSMIWDETDPTEFDYADALFFQAVAQAMVAQIDIMSAYDFDVDIDAQQQADLDGDNVTAESFLADHPNFGNLVDSDALATAETSARAAVATMTDAVNAIATEYDGGDDQSDDLMSFYMWDWDQAYYDESAEEEMLTLLQDIEGGFENAVTVDDNGTVNDASDDIELAFYNFFEGFDFRDQVPEFTEDTAGNFPDPKLDGIIVDPTKLDINLDEDGDASPDLINGYTRFFDDYILGSKATANYYDTEGSIFGYEEIFFNYDGSFDYYSNDFSTIDYNEATGSWEIDADGKLNLYFDEPVPSLWAESNMDSIIIDLIEGGQNYGDVQVSVNYFSGQSELNGPSADINSSWYFGMW